MTDDRGLRLWTKSAKVAACVHESVVEAVSLKYRDSAIHRISFGDTAEIDSERFMKTHETIGKQFD